MLLHRHGQPGALCMCLKCFLVGHKANCFKWCNALVLWGITALLRQYARVYIYIYVFFFPQCLWKGEDYCLFVCVLHNNLSEAHCIMYRICNCSWGMYWFCVLYCSSTLWGSGSLQLWWELLSSSPLSLNWLNHLNMHSFLENWEIVWEKWHVLGSVSPK